MTSPRDRWDARYADGPGSTEPAAMLDEIADLLPATGTVVDVGGGSGRNALWFARRGHDVTVIDVSPTGLDHARRTAQAAGLDLECVERDLEADGMPPGRTWDIVFMHLFFDRPLVRALPASLAPGGMMIFAQPTVTNLERHPSPSARFLLAEGEIAELAEGLTGVEIVRADEAWRAGGRHEAWLIARRR